MAADDFDLENPTLDDNIETEPQAGAPEAVADTAPEPDASASGGDEALRFLENRGAELERENEQLRQQIARYSQPSQTPPPARTPEKPTANIDPANPWEPIVDRIMGERLKEAVGPLHQFVQAQSQREAEREESSRFESTTANVIQGAERACAYFAKTLPYAKDDSDTAKEIASDVIEEMKTWRASNGRAWDRAVREGRVAPPDYYKMALDRYKHLLGKFQAHHARIQTKSAKIAQERRSGASAPSTGSGRSASASKPQTGKKFDADLWAEDFAQKNGYRQ